MGVAYSVVEKTGAERRPGKGYIARSQFQRMFRASVARTNLKTQLDIAVSGCHFSRE
jgi:hypothetical protein